MNMIKSKQNKAITLISLIVTIIIIIIIAGISISLFLGGNGIIQKLKESKSNYLQTQEREKLELILLELQANKVTDNNYNEQDYINNKIKESGMHICDDTVLVNRFSFTIDRTVPKIIDPLGYESYLITYNLQGGTASTIKNQIKLYNKDINIPAEIPKKAGYTFEGWSVQSDSKTGEYKANSIYSQNSNSSLYAIWHILPVVKPSSSTCNYSNRFSIVSSSSFRLTTAANYEYVYIPVKDCVIGRTYRLTFTLGVSNAIYYNKYDYKYSIGSSTNNLTKNKSNNKYTVNFKATNSTMNLSLIFGDLKDGYTYNIYFLANSITAL